MSDADRVRAIGAAAGLDLRITNSEPFTAEARRIREQLDEGLFLDRPARGRIRHYYEPERFCDAGTLLPGVRSIISAYLPYFTGDEPDPSTPDDPHGAIARYTRCDHYRELRRRLRRVAGQMRSAFHCRARVVTNGAIAEKPVAARAGTGFYGKHSIIINNQHGSWIVLGEILTDLVLDVDAPSRDDCGACDACLRACPTHAITRPYVIDRRLCIQALSNWYGVLPRDVASVWGNRLYGCTTCQDVCPRNAGVIPVPRPTTIGCVGGYASLREILEMSETEYRKRFAANQLSARWIEVRAIKRNALVALGAARGPAARRLLERFAGHRDPVLAATARQSLKRC